MSFYTAARDGQIELLRRYLVDGVDIHQRFNDDRTALHFACDGGNYEVVKLLLEHKADVNLPDAFNKDTPLHLAAEAGHTEIVRLLIELDPHDLHERVSFRTDQGRSFVQHQSDVNVQDQMNGETPLHLACEGGFTDIVELLLQTDVDLTIENVYKKTALHYANEGSGALIRAYHERQPGRPSAATTHAPATGEDPGSQARRDGSNGGGGMASGYAALGGQESRGARGVGAKGRQNSPSPEHLGETGGWQAATREDFERASTSWYAAWSMAGQSSDGRDKPNQDAFIIVPVLNGDPEVFLFGVFDGHGRYGHLAAAFCKANLAQLLPGERVRRGMATTNPELGGKGKVVDAAAGKATGGMAALLAEACTALQQKLSEQAEFEVAASGCTALIALMVKDVLYVANVGDSRGVLAHVSNPNAQQGPDREQLTVVPLTIDQIPGLKEERERIEGSGGQVRRDESTLTGEQGPFRVWRQDMQGPGLAMARSLGDAMAHEIGVTHLPTVREYRVTESDRMLLLATDGVWDMLENGEAVDIAARASGDCRHDPAHAAEQLCETARRAWEFKETRIDDITALLVFLPPSVTRAPQRFPPQPAPAPQQPYPLPAPQRFAAAPAPVGVPQRQQPAEREYQDYLQMAQGDLERRAMPYYGGDPRAYGTDPYDDPDPRDAAPAPYQPPAYSPGQAPGYGGGSGGVGYSVSSGYQVRQPYGQYQGGGAAYQQGPGGQGQRPRRQAEPERGLFDGFPGLNLGGSAQREPGQKEEDCVVQ